MSSRSAYPVGATTAPLVNPGLLRCLSISPPSSFHPSSFEALLRQQIRLRYPFGVFPFVLVTIRIAAQRNSAVRYRLSWPSCCPELLISPDDSFTDYGTLVVKSSIRNTRVCEEGNLCAHLFSIDNQLRSLNPTRPINREDAQRSRTHRDRKRKFANLEPLPLPLSITESLTKHTRISRQTVALTSHGASVAIRLPDPEGRRCRGRRPCLQDGLQCGRHIPVLSVLALRPLVRLGDPVRRDRLRCLDLEHGDDARPRQRL